MPDNKMALACAHCGEVTVFEKTIPPELDPYNPGNIVMELEMRRRQVEELRTACEAGIRYDEAIQSCVNDPEKMASYCTAHGEELDAVYFDWLNKARAAIAKANP